MSIILNIDTSSSVASVSIGQQGNLLYSIQNEDQKEHASFLQPAIKKLLLQLHMQLNDIDAVAVVNGPGSYTGLRVGMASAKGICYALKKPLISIGSLPLMSKAAIDFCKNEEYEVSFFCPMIDARRMEVFTAVYNSTLKEILSPRALILTNESFVEILLQDKILFFGNGSTKFKSILKNANALFADDYNKLEAFCKLSFDHFMQKDFTDLTYSEPLYLKEFFNGEQLHK